MRRSKEDREDCSAYHCRPMAPKFSTPIGLTGEAMVDWWFSMPREALLSISQWVTMGGQASLAVVTPSFMSVQGVHHRGATCH